MNCKRTILSVVFSVAISVGFAQDVETNIWMKKPFKADGLSVEWNEPLNQFNSDTKLAFALANDDQNLYIVIESLDPATTRKVLFGGITLNINTAGKKKKAINLTFPFRDKAPLPGDGKWPDSVQKAGDESRRPPEHKPDQQEMPQHEAVQGIKVSGFKNIKDGILRADNEFGIISGMSVKSNQDLIYEIAIPLKQLQVGLDLKKAIAYNIKLNASGKPDGDKGKGGPPGGGGRPGGGMGGMGGGAMGGGSGGGQHPPQGDADGSANRKTDFWIKFKLVKA